jgi:hypothetical protein
MIIEKEKILWKPRNAGIVCGGSAYIGKYVHGVNVRISCLMRNFYINEQMKTSLSKLMEVLE